MGADDSEEKSAEPSVASAPAPSGGDVDEAKAESSSNSNSSINLDVASPRVLYPCMQCADPFFLKVRIQPCTSDGHFTCKVHPVIDFFKFVAALVARPIFATCKRHNDMS
jgi:hypothetical protein